MVNGRDAFRKSPQQRFTAASPCIFMKNGYYNGNCSVNKQYNGLMKDSECLLAFKNIDTDSHSTL